MTIRTRHAGATTITGIGSVASPAPWLIRMVLAYPTGPVAQRATVCYPQQMVKRSRYFAPPVKMPRLTAEQRKVMRAGISELRMRADKQVYAKGKDKPICSGETMLELCEMDYFKPVKKWRGEMM